MEPSSISAPAPPLFGPHFPPASIPELPSQLGPLWQSLPSTSSSTCGQRPFPLTCFIQTQLYCRIRFHSCILCGPHSGCPIPELALSSADSPFPRSSCPLSGFSLHTYFLSHFLLSKATCLLILQAQTDLTLLPGSPPRFPHSSGRSGKGVFMHVSLQPCNLLEVWDLPSLHLPSVAQSVGGAHP